MPDPTTIERLKGLILSARDLRELTDWPGALIEDYLNLVDNFITLANLLDVEIDLELESLIYSMPEGKSYDSAISDIKALIFSSPNSKNYDNIISDIAKSVYQQTAEKAYDKIIDDLKKIIVSEVYAPSGDAEMEIFTSLGSRKIQKDLTFSNDAGTLTLFTVTGDVWVNILPVITTDVTSAALANIRLGIVGNTDAMIVDSQAVDLDARGIWVDQTPDHEIESTERIRGYFITDGNDVVLTLDAQVDAGAITFYCFWSPLSTEGNVAVA